MEEQPHAAGAEVVGRGNEDGSFFSLHSVHCMPGSVKIKFKLDVNLTKFIAACHN